MTLSLGLELETQALLRFSSTIIYKYLQEIIMHHVVMVHLQPDALAFPPKAYIGIVLALYLVALFITSMFTWKKFTSVRLHE